MRNIGRFKQHIVTEDYYPRNLKLGIFGQNFITKQK